MVSRASPVTRLALGLVWLILFCASALAASIDVSIEHDSVRLDVSFSLHFTARDAPDGEPDFSPLKQDFEILGQSRSSHISIVNGDYRKSIEWTLTVMAKREGRVTVPSIVFGKDRSSPLSITVAGNSTAPDDDRDAKIFLEVDAEPKSPYVQAQLIYTVRVMVRRGISLGSADLSEPLLDDALIQKLGDDKRYAASRDGLSYGVIERRYAIFPQKSGTVIIEPMVLNAQVTSAGHSMFDRFFNQLPSRNIRVRSEAVSLQVRAVPAAFTGKHWLPASKLELEEAWSRYPPQVTAGTPITRTLSLKAQSAAVGLLPELTPQAGTGSEIKQYPDQPFLKEEKHINGVNSVRQEKTALVLTRAGEYSLPGLEIPWWNTRTDQMEVARLPTRTISVLPAAQAAAPAGPPSTETQVSPGKAAPAATPAQANAPSEDRMAGLWRWLALLFGSGWAATAGAWWWSSTRRAPPAPRIVEADQPTDSKAPAKRLRQACLENDPAAARRALLDWARTSRSSASPPRMTDIGERASPELKARIDELNEALYGPNGGTWQGQAFWNAFSAHTKDEALSEKDRRGSLEPLYKL
jgi:hypothetical protein